MKYILWADCFLLLVKCATSVNHVVYSSVLWLGSKRVDAKFIWFLTKPIDQELWRGATKWQLYPFSHRLKRFQDPCNHPRVRDTEASRAVFVVVCETNAISLAIDSWALLSMVLRSQILPRELRSSPSPTHQVSLLPVLVGFWRPKLSLRKRTLHCR